MREIGSDEITRVTHSTERDIAGYFWVGDNRLVYINDQGGDENWKIYAVNADNTDDKVLTPFDEVQARFVDDLEDDSDHVLVKLCPI